MPWIGRDREALAVSRSCCVLSLCVYRLEELFFNSSTPKQTRNPGSGVSLMGLAEACKAWRCGAG
ncbi:hypothetical protein V8C44DRAFT_326018 [Trichoderma aethiopicum]